VKIGEKTIPSVIKQYNEYMGGFDKFDQMIKYYPIKRKTRRWVNRLNCHVMQLLVHNAFVIYSEFSAGPILNNYDLMGNVITYFISTGGI
jgi:hypothetical protein